MPTTTTFLSVKSTSSFHRAEWNIEPLKFSMPGMSLGHPLGSTRPPTQLTKTFALTISVSEYTAASPFSCTIFWRSHACHHTSKSDLPLLLFLQPRALLDVCVQLKLVRDFILRTNIVVVLDDFATGWVKRRPIRVLGETKTVESGSFLLLDACDNSTSLMRVRMASGTYERH